MKRLLMLIPLVFLCCLGCQQGQEVAPVDVEADIQAIKDIVADYNAAIIDLLRETLIGACVSMSIYY